MLFIIWSKNSSFIHNFKIQKKNKNKFNHLLDNIIIDLSNHFWNFASMINLWGKEKKLNLLKFISSKINLNSLMLVKVIYHV